MADMIRETPPLVDTDTALVVENPAKDVKDPAKDVKDLAKDGKDPAKDVKDPAKDVKDLAKDGKDPAKDTDENAEEDTDEDAIRKAQEKAKTLSTNHLKPPSKVAPKPPSEAASKVTDLSLQDASDSPPTITRPVLSRTTTLCLSPSSPDQLSRFSEFKSPVEKSPQTSDLAGSKRKAEDGKTAERNVKSCIKSTITSPAVVSKRPPIDPRTDHRKKQLKPEPKGLLKPEPKGLLKIPTKVFDSVTSVWNMTFLIDEVETDDFYKSYLDSQITAIEALANTKIETVNILGKVYDDIRDYAKEIIIRVDVLRNEGEGKIAMPLSRCEWCKDATELAEALVEVVETEKTALNKAIETQVFGDSDAE
ncbi:hypothetical protein T484DRAFT_1863558 [Baffinella frigidus]|nr:hypothetical protein T484DRAFT_1863558 [Cryptophyta sp. CCMP2293]